MSKVCGQNLYIRGKTTFHGSRNKMLEVPAINRRLNHLQQQRRGVEKRQPKLCKMTVILILMEVMILHFRLPTASEEKSKSNGWATTGTKQEQAMRYHVHQIIQNPNAFWEAEEAGAVSFIPPKWYNGFDPSATTTASTRGFSLAPA